MFDGYSAGYYNLLAMESKFYLLLYERRDKDLGKMAFELRNGNPDGSLKIEVVQDHSVLMVITESCREFF